jgi:hypothetical protein
VAVNTDAPISIDAGSSKIVQVVPGTYKIVFSSNDGLMFDTLINVVDHAEILKKNPKQTSVRYLITPPDRPPVVAATKKTNEIKKIDRPTVVDNSKLSNKVDYLQTVTTQSLQLLEKGKLLIEKQNTIVLKGDNEEVTKRKTLLQIKDETTALLQSVRNAFKTSTTDINANVADYNTLIQELQKAKPDNEATKILLQKATNIQRNLIKLQELQLETTKLLNNSDIILTPKLQGIKPMSESLEVALSHNRTDDYKFFVTPQNINNIKVNAKSIILYLIDEKANYETFFYFIQQGLEVNDFDNYLKMEGNNNENLNNVVNGLLKRTVTVAAKTEGNIYASPILKACIAELDINIIELLLKKGAKTCPSLTFPDKRKANNQYLYNTIKKNNTLLLLFIKYGFSFKQ